MYPDSKRIRNFFFADSKIFTSTLLHVSGFKVNLPVHVSGFVLVSRTPPLLLSTEHSLSGVRLAKAFRSAAMLNIYAVKAGSEFVISSDLKVSGFDRQHDSKFIADSNFPLWRVDLKSGGFAGCVWMCGYFANPQRKSCGFKIIWISVDGGLKQLIVAFQRIFSVSFYLFIKLYLYKG